MAGQQNGLRWWNLAGEEPPMRCTPYADVLQMMGWRAVVAGRRWASTSTEHLLSAA